MEVRGTALDFGGFLERTVGKVGYVIGGRGHLCTSQFIAAMRASYPAQAGKIDQCASKWLGMPVADCLGWCEMFENGGDAGRPVSTFKYPDRRTYQDYSLAKSLGLPNGPIATIPKGLPYPIAVGYEGHVGYYHKGQVYQSAGHCSGTIITRLDEVISGLSAWVYWYQLPYLAVPEEKTMLKYGQNSPEVRAWQEALVVEGSWAKVPTVPLPEPNDNFGPHTQKATNVFKAAQGLPQDGIVDEVTFGRMLNVLRLRPTYQSQFEEAQRQVILAQTAYNQSAKLASEYLEKARAVWRALDALKQI